ncbi:glutamate--cysteine ligase [Saccharothrix sp. BKS2]|uniref:carboxylate-amine ligase n=1 Tax=Saccharothrix sp. BKS2 TaxID=3064400 RepID=UPI0039ED65A4
MALTVGVEEEFLLTDVTTRRAVCRSADVLRATVPRVGGGIVAEMAETQVETVSRVCADLPELRSELLGLRRVAARAAEDAGCRLVGSGTVVLGSPGPPPVLDRPRYHRIVERFGPLVDQQCVCSCHVHVGIADHDEAVQVVNHLRPWLPVLLAISGNSPYWEGRDTGYHSWRTQLWGRWPMAGPPPRLAGAAEYREVVADLVGSGAILDDAMLYWYVRPSHHQPTVEVRVADVPQAVDDAVLLAALVKGLATTALAEVRAGRGAPHVADQVLRAACWRASRYGLPEDGVAGAAAGAAAPAADGRTWSTTGVSALLNHIGPVLDAAGETGFVLDALRERRLGGSGSHRQRLAHRRRGRLEDVVDMLADRAVAG